MEIEFSTYSKKFLKKCEKEVYSRVLNKIKELKNNPFPSECKKLQGRKNLFRIRIGKIRILYIILKEKNTLLIADINKRSKIYD